MIKRNNNKKKRKPASLKYIYKKKYGTYSIDKSINGKIKHFKTCKTVDEAIHYRNRLIANNWEPLPPTPEEIYANEYKKYYSHINLTITHRQYQVTNRKYEYIGTCNSLPEALYYRDLYFEHSFDECPRPKEIDLNKNNPYKNNLKYPIPDKLIPKKTTGYGKGSIKCNGEFNYSIYHGSKKNTRYVCSCRTYEQAYYVRQEMNKCGWDRKKLQKILDDYPIWYTWLMEFYRYIHLDYEHKKRTGECKYKINVPREYLSEGKQLEHYTGYSNVEDALFERDFLVNHDWDYDYLVEAIDDTVNPYYSMDLPPYPQRIILNNSERDYHEKELTHAFELLSMDTDLSQEDVSDYLGISEVTIRNWLSKFWNSDWIEFRKIALTGENPCNVLERVPLIYTPDLSRPKPPNFKGYIHFRKDHGRSPYKIVKDGIRYGSYHTEKQARKAVKLLEKCNWDKNKVSSIQASVGWKPLTERGNIYPANNGKSYSIRKKDKNRKMINYGHYKDYRLAVMVRDMLILNDWNKEEYPQLRYLCEEILPVIRLLESNMFSGVYSEEDIEHICYLEELNNYDITNTRYILQNEYGKYMIRRRVHGKLTSFGTYDNKHDALFAYDLLENNNWDKDCLKIVEEMGK